MDKMNCIFWMVLLENSAVQWILKYDCWDKILSNKRKIKSVFFSLAHNLQSVSDCVQSDYSTVNTAQLLIHLHCVDSQRASDKHTAVQCQMSNTTLLVNNMRHRVFNHCLVFWPDMTHIWCVSHCSCVQDVFNLKRQKKRVFAHFMSNRKTKVLNVCLLWLIKDTVKSVFWPVNATLYDGLCHTEAWVDCADPICCICNQSLCSPVQ